MTIRCVDGRAMRHDPQPDDPDFETDTGECEECDGNGCYEIKENDELITAPEFVEASPVRSVLLEIHGHLHAALIQQAPSDDAIIMDHIRKADALALELILFASAERAAVCAEALHSKMED